LNTPGKYTLGRWGSFTGWPDAFTCTAAAAAAAVPSSIGLVALAACVSYLPLLIEGYQFNAVSWNTVVAQY